MKTDVTLVQLRKAIHQLESFVSSSNEDSLSSSVSRTVKLVLSLFQDDSKPKEDVFHAVEIILRQRFYIRQLQEGTPEEKELAASFTRAIVAYNNALDERIHNKGIERFLKDPQKKKPPKVTLPQDTTIQQCYPERASHDIIRNTFLNGTKGTSPIGLPQEITALFRMKVISLLEGSGKVSPEEARIHIKEAPTPACTKMDNFQCLLTQTLNLFPGQVVTVTGVSDIDPRTHSIKKLYPETFRLHFESTQTGFPHPSQRAGWSLAYELLPNNPQRSDLLEKTAPLFIRKNNAVTDLLAQGRFLKSAKELLVQKKKYFQQHKNELISLHRELALTITDAAPKNLIREDAHTVISKFYETLDNHPTPYEWLSGTHYTLKELCITKPYQKLLESIIKGKSTAFGSPNAHDRYNLAKDILDLSLNEINYDGSFNEKVRADYVACLGSIFGNASKNIILQYLSEDLIFSPPLLTPFEKKVQASVYQHLHDFLHELESPPENIGDLMKKEILLDITLFKEQSKMLPIPEELARYFDLRYASLQTLYRE